ncbi:MAG TPA: hypothetical protein VHV32_19180 [Candidatus Angelobacter sp.]|jgi:hypothetical protein|nr:hypothetical protein [Candidatus Angelobacter sp.]
MTLTQAELLVRERWGRLGLSPEEFPRVFSSDVDNMLEEAASTQNILDVAPQQDQPTKAVNHESGAGEVRLKTGDGCARKPLTNTNSDTHLTRKNTSAYLGGGCPSYSPLYLLASEIVGLVTKGYEQ